MLTDFRGPVFFISFFLFLLICYWFCLFFCGFGCFGIWPCAVNGYSSHLVDFAWFQTAPGVDPTEFVYVESDVSDEKPQKHIRVYLFYTCVYRFL